MPHIIYQCSDTVDKGKLLSLTQGVHQLLVNGLPTKIESCVSRVVQSDQYYIGAANELKGFLSIQIMVLPGRSQDLLKQISQDILKLADSIINGDLSSVDEGGQNNPENQFKLSVYILEAPDNYCKNF